MNTLDDYTFKRRRNKRKFVVHSPPVCEVIVCCRSTGRVERKRFSSWDSAREYANQRAEAGRKYHVTVERL